MPSADHEHVPIPGARAVSWLSGLVFLAAVALSVIVLLHVAVRHNRTHLLASRIAPEQVSVINQHTLRTELYPRDGELGRKLLAMAYGPQADMVRTTEHPVSIGVEAEFTLPHLQVDGTGYLLREAPSLRYRLMAQQAPDVVLLGSSIFFQGFNREEFFRTYPERKLVDFTMGNNRPAITLYLLQQAHALGLKFAPGSAVLYGINEFELIEGYGGSWQYVKDSIEYELGTAPWPTLVSTFLLRSFGMRTLRNSVLALPGHLVDQMIARIGGSTPPAPTMAASAQPATAAKMPEAPKSCARREFDTYAVYNFIVPADCVANLEALTSYLMAQIPAGLSILTVPYSQAQIDNLGKIRDLVSAMGGRLVIIRLPTSDYVTARSPSYRHHFSNRIGAVIDQIKTPYFDASVFKNIGISDMDFLWSHNRFDPEHLNFEGSRRFTQYILKNVYEPMRPRADGRVNTDTGIKK